MSCCWIGYINIQSYNRHRLVFQYDCANLHSHEPRIKISLDLESYQPLVVSDFFFFSFLPAWCKIVAHVVLICILLIINKIDLLFIRWSVFHVTLLNNAWSCLLLMFLTGLTVVYAANNFPQLMACLFIFFVMSWWMRVLKFNVIEFMNIFNYCWCLLPYWRKPVLFGDHKDILLYFLSVEKFCRSDLRL